MKSEKKRVKIEKFIRGIVTGKKMDKTIGVKVLSIKQHKLYLKRTRINKHYLAHCETDLEVGDSVLLQETRPKSRKKRWVVVKKIIKGDDSNS